MALLPELHWTDVERLAERLSRRARPAVVALTGVAVLAGAHALRVQLRARAQALRAEIAVLDERLEEARQAAGEEASSRDTKALELRRFKRQLTTLTQSRRSTYEIGLQIQEEKRLLEKQWEIMTTYLLVDSEAKKIHLMRGEQSLESYPIAYVPPQAFGGEIKPPAWPTPIVSKERFAHPERGKSEQVNGQLQWEPPQVGTSVRANALGQFVVFTRGTLILHGPPSRPKEHQAFPHFCLGLSLAVARRLYAQTYIGTKVLLKPAAAQAKR